MPPVTTIALPTKAVAVKRDNHEATKKKRRWAMTLVVLLAGAGAAARSGRRSRAR